MTDPAASLTHRTLRGMAWVAWWSAAVAVMRLGVLVLLTRLLAPADFGLVSAAMVFITFSLNFSQLGMGPALVQRPVLEPRHVSTAALASTVLGVLVAALVWVSAPLIADFFHMVQLVPVLRWLALLFPIGGLSVVPENLLQRELRFRVLANRDLLAYGLGYGVVGVTLAMAGFGVWALVAAQLTQALLRTAILLRAGRPTVRARPSWRSFFELMEFGIGQSVGRLGVIVANQVDNLVVGRELGAVALGQYSRAFQLVSVPTALLGDVLDRVLFPTMARIQDEQRRLASAFLTGTALLTLLTLPTGVVIAVLAPELVDVAFGDRWAALVPPFQVLVLGVTFRTSWRMSDSLSRATGQVYRRAWRQVLFAFLIFLGAFIGHYWGLTGVAAGVLAALFANFLLMAHLGMKMGQVSWFRFVQVQLPAIRLTLVVAVATSATAAVARHLGLLPIITLAAGLIAAAGTAVAAAWLSPTLTLGEHGVRLRDVLRTQLLGGPRLTGPGASA